MVDQEPVPDSAMDTGSDAGEPGGSTDATPLTDDERAILDRLRHSDRPEVVEGVPEESPAAAAAVDDDAPLPAASPPDGEGDPLDPVFREPTA